MSQCHLKFLKGFQVKANIAIPILLRDEDVPPESLWGLLIVHQCSAPREWQKSELELLQLLATQIAIAIQQGELYQQAQNEITRRKQVEAEIRKSESQLRTALDAAALGTWSWNMVTNEVSLSERSQSLFGFNLGEFPGTLDAVLNRLHPQDRLKMDEKNFEAIASKGLYDLETRVLLPNGNSRWLSARGHVLPNLEGQPKQMVGVIADISEKKQLEEQFLRHQRLESLGSLASGIAHDLNNIFTPILMSVQLLPVTLAQIDPRSRELIQMVENNVKRGSALVQQILSFARGIEGERGIVQVKHIIMQIFGSSLSRLFRNLSKSELMSRPISGLLKEMPAKFIKFCSIWRLMPKMPCLMADCSIFLLIIYQSTNNMFGSIAKLKSVLIS